MRRCATAIMAASAACALCAAGIGAAGVSPAETAVSPAEAPRRAGPDLRGTWEIREEDRTYYATLDEHGNGPYTHEGGSLLTTHVHGRLWSGQWTQTGNDREGGFEVRLSEDGSTAEGRWWYTRVGRFEHIPPRAHGGSYAFRRMAPGEPLPAAP